MKIGCWEVPKPSYPPLLWLTEWKAPAPLVMTFFNVLPILLLAVAGKQESVLEKRTEETTEINYQHQGKWRPWSLRMVKNWLYFIFLGKCRLSQLDDDMETFTINKGEEHVLTLKQLRRKYPQGGKSNLAHQALRDVIMTFPQTKNSRRRPLQSARMSSRMSKIYLLGQKFASRLPTRASL